MGDPKIKGPVPPPTPPHTGATEATEHADASTPSTAPSGPASVPQRDQIVRAPQDPRIRRAFTRRSTRNDRTAREELMRAIEQRLQELGRTLSPEERERLMEVLNHLHGAELQREIDFLQNHVLNTPNADRALRTYVELRQLQQNSPHRPPRLDNALIHTLTRGVAEPRLPGSPQGQEGVLNYRQALQAARTMQQMPERFHQDIRQLLSQARQPVEQMLILKAVAARAHALSNPQGLDALALSSSSSPYRTGSPEPPYRLSPTLRQLHAFADTIRGMERNALIQRTTGIDVDTDQIPEAIRQQFTNACVPTVAQMVRAEADPVYALWVNRHPAYLTAEQQILGREVGVDVSQRGLSISQIRRLFRRASGADLTTLFTGQHGGLVTGYTQHVYRLHRVTNTQQARQRALDKIEHQLRNGLDVPIGVDVPNNPIDHELLITDVRGTGDQREFLITDPATGQTQWVSAQDLIQGTFQIGKKTYGRMLDYMI